MDPAAASPLLERRRNGAALASSPWCLVDSHTIHCASCGQAWRTAVPFSVYEQQAVESCPCPDCGAYTLCCQDPVEVAGIVRTPRPTFALAGRTR